MVVLATTSSHETRNNSNCDISVLVRLQRHLSRVQIPDAQLMLRRSSLLNQLGHADLARCDAERALALDPVDPLAMLALCRFDEERAHDLARQVIASPFATKEQRRSALIYLDPARLPEIVHCALCVTERLTLMQGPTDQISLSGLDATDFPEAVGQVVRAGRQVVVATDYFVERHGELSRDIQIGMQDAFITVEPLASPPIVATNPDEAVRLWVIVPVKDGGAVLSRCLASVRRELKAMPTTRLIIVDDQSQLPETRRLLDEYSISPRVSVVRSDRQLGFTKAVNLGLTQIGTGAVLLLNSDTYLPPYTLNRMLAHLVDRTIGTVTPLSNNGGSFSIPTPRTAFEMPDKRHCDQIARAAYDQNRGICVDVLTGNGFAMMISADCMKQVGALSEYYASGYYEEVDFCLRASQQEFRHVAAVDCFVGHVGSLSYGSEKQILVAENRRRIQLRFPSYAAAFAGYGLIDPIARYRDRLTDAATLVRRVQDLPKNVFETTEGIAAPTELLLGDGQDLLLPIIGTDVSGELCLKLDCAFDKIRVVPEIELNAFGLSLRPRHALRAAIDTGGGSLTVTGAGDEPIATFDFAGADAEDFAVFEKALIHAHMKAKHVVSV